MKIAVFQHTPSETPGFFNTIFTGMNIPIQCICLYETNEIPETDASHFIFLGGPMSVNDEREYPYLKEEKVFIRNAVKDKKRILGICLGAQLIASAFGGNVYKFVQETGWYQIRREPETISDFSVFPDTFFAFQLHGDTFEIPFGGRLLCSGDRVKNQAFMYRSALGLQFHLEITNGMLRDWSRGLRPFLREKILREMPRYISGSNSLCQRLAENFIRQ
jgi:GMP synthase-like glutamine amidotransferase